MELAHNSSRLHAAMQSRDKRRQTITRIVQRNKRRRRRTREADSSEKLARQPTAKGRMKGGRRAEQIISLDTRFRSMT